MTNVADLVLDGPDALGERIFAFYGRRPPLYAVYSARRRVTIHYADDAAVADKQRKALAQLTPNQREALLLVTAEDLPYEEAAAICGVAVGTIKSRVYRARETLAQILDISGIDDLGPDKVSRAATQH